MTEERKFERGQVYYVKYDDAIGGEMSVGRPALIVSNQSDINEMDTVIVVFMTTGLRKSNNVVKIVFNGRQQYIHCSQIKTMDKSRLSECLGKLDDRDMKRVGNALALAMSYNATIVAPKQPDDKEKITELEVELDVHKKLYEKALEKLAELRFEKDVAEEIPEPEVFEEFPEEPELETEIEPEPELIEDIPLDISALEKKFRQYDEEQKKKRALSHGDLNSVLAKAGTEKPTPKKKSSDRQEPKIKKVKINKASRYDLENIGIKSQVAYKILEYRIKNGNFHDVEDLLLVSGFGRKELNKYGNMLEV